MLSPRVFLRFANPAVRLKYRVTTIKFNTKVMASAAKADPAALRLRRASFLASLGRPVSPPPRAGSQQASTPEVIDLVSDEEDVPQRKKQRLEPSVPIPGRSSSSSVPQKSAQMGNSRRTITSPFQLSKIADLPDSDNIDAVSLHDLLGSK